MEMTAAGGKGVNVLVNIPAFTFLCEATGRPSDLSVVNKAAVEEREKRGDGWWKGEKLWDG